MLRVTIIAVGKLKEKYFREACSEYNKRLSAYCKLNIIEVDETKCPNAPSQSEINNVIDSEGDKIIGKIPKGSYIIPLCIEGKTVSSKELANLIDNASVFGESHIVFIIGGSWGLSEKVKNMAKFKLSMSPMTFPHMLARVMLLEQVYRSFMITAGTEYHK